MDYVTQSYSYFYVPASSTTNPNIGFYIPNNFSGEYDIYLVTMPYWIYQNNFETEKHRYRFRASIWEMGADGKFPSTGTQLTVDGVNTFETPEPVDIFAKTDTTYLGTYDFKYAYYGESESGYILQINPNILSSQRTTYTNSMLFSAIILRPHQEEETVEDTPVEVKAFAIKPTVAKKTPSNVFYKSIKQ